MQKMMKQEERRLEVCCADLDSVLAAKAGGAHRVELCEALELDGLTPRSELIGKAVESGIRVHVLIRPREGDFNYTEPRVWYGVRLLARDTSTCPCAAA